MISMRKNIGIIASIILILNYVWGAAMSLFFPENTQILEINSTLGRLIFTLCLFGFYYALILCLRPHNFRPEINVLKAYLLIVVTSFILHTVYFYHGTIPEFLLSLLYNFALIAFIIFGIMVMRRSNKKYVNMKRLKAFVISMFIIYGIILIKVAMLLMYRSIDYLNIIYVVYAIPYVFGLRFFMNEDIEITD